MTRLKLSVFMLSAAIAGLGGVLYSAQLRTVNGTNGGFFMKMTTAGLQTNLLGLPSDFIVVGDYDGDGRTDLAVRRTAGAVRSSGPA